MAQPIISLEQGDGIGEVESDPAAGDGPEAGNLEIVHASLRDLISRLSVAERECRDQSTEHFESTRKLLLEIITINDAFEDVWRLVQEMKGDSDPSVKRWLQRFRTIQRLLLRMLKDRDVVEIEILNPIFDPHWHRAAEVVEDPDRPDGHIVSQKRKGYLWRKTILRKPEVVVVRND